MTIQYGPTLKQSKKSMNPIIGSAFLCVPLLVVLLGHALKNAFATEVVSQAIIFLGGGVASLFGVAGAGHWHQDVARNKACVDKTE